VKWRIPNKLQNSGDDERLISNTLWLVMGPGQNIFVRVDLRNLFLLESGQPLPGLENFPQKSQIFKIFPFLSKKISSCRVTKYRGQIQVGPIFTVFQIQATIKIKMLSKLNFIID